MITFVDAKAVSSDHVAMPTHAAGHLIVGTAVNGSNTGISVPSGWTPHYLTDSNNGVSMVVAHKFAANSTEQSGTWTNAEHLLVTVYSNVSTVGTFVEASGSSSNVLFDAVTSNSTVWAVAGAVHSAAAVPNGDLTRRASKSLGVYSKVWDTAGQTGYNSQSEVGVSGAWRSYCMQVNA